MINPAYHQAHSVFIPDNNQMKGQSYKRYDNNKKEKLSEKDYRKKDMLHQHHPRRRRKQNKSI
jgi:hypothetical protein